MFPGLCRECRSLSARGGLGGKDLPEPRWEGCVCPPPTPGLPAPRGAWVTAFPQCSEARGRSAQCPGPAIGACKPSHDCSHPPVTEGAFSSAPAAATSSPLVTARAHKPAHSWAPRSQPPAAPVCPTALFFPRLWAPHSFPSPQPFLNIAAPGTDLARAQKDQADRGVTRRCFPRGPWLLLGNIYLAKSQLELPCPPPHQKVTDAQRLRGGPHVAGPPHTRPG